MTDRALVVVAGPVAGGKSTVTRELAGKLRASGTAAAVIDLDRLYLMQDESFVSESAWRNARVAAGVLAQYFFDAGFRVVIAEGGFYSQRELDELLERVSDEPRVLFVTLLVSFERALQRAQDDPDPGRVASRDAVLLRTVHDHFESSLPFLRASGVVVDANVRRPGELADNIVELVSTTLGETTSPTV